MPLTISRILHAGYVFASGATTIAFDPIFENPFSRNCHAFPGVRFDHERIRALGFDAVFISHFHDDHCSLDSLNLLPRATPIYIYCLFDEIFEMVRALGFTKVQPLQIDVPVAIGDVEVIARRALDADVDSMFQIRAAGLNVLNVVDAWIDPDALTQLAAFAPWDLVLWPFQTMREIDVLSPSRATPAPPTLPEEWFDQLKTLAPRYVVPSSCQFLQESWSWYNHAFFPITYRQFQREIEAALPGTRVVRMNPSVSMTLHAASLDAAPPLSWVVPVGEQDVDYDYQPGVKAPPTCEIATRFAPLTEEQAARVLAFCTSGLPARYRDMELPPGSYFEQERNWRLSIYDHAGQRSDFFYRIEGDSITAIDGEDTALAWTTEIAAAKIYAALELGESLTSMYMRINDAVFDAAVEAEIGDADIVDDPLIRCLFDDAFGAYQAAQLRSIKAAAATAQGGVSTPGAVS